MKRFITLGLFYFLFCNNIVAQKDLSFPIPNTILKIVPSKTDSRIYEANTPHLVLYNSTSEQGKLLLFLPGTGGIADRGPKEFFYAAVDLGYHVINLSYINTPAIAQICNGGILQENTTCAADFRVRRIYGTNTFPLIKDESFDAIENRLIKLLLYLAENDKKGNWNSYIENGKPKWEQIALAGQSQGGGMAAFIAKEHVVARVIDFSGGWDFSAKGQIAKWYSNSSVTPLNRYYATYHKQEPQAAIIVATYKALGIPENHVYAFDLEVPEGKKAHSNGVSNAKYKDKWIELLGRGN